MECEKKIKNVEEMPAADDKLSNLIQQAFVFDRISQFYGQAIRKPWPEELLL